MGNGSRGSGELTIGRWRLPRTSAYVLAICVAILGVAAVAGLPFASHPAFLPHPALPWWVLAAGFAATEACVLHVQVRRETQTISLSEIPLVLGLFLASPLTIVAARVLASAVVLFGYRRSPAIKITFNLALACAETCVAVALFDLLTRTAEGADPLSWLAAYVAALAANALGVLAIGGVIALHEGARPHRALLRQAFVQPVPPTAVTIALVAVTALTASVTSAWLLCGFGALLLLAFRTYASLAERHLNLERLYHFSQAVSSSTEIEEVMASVLGEARELLRSERAAAAFVADNGNFMARVRLEPGASLIRSEEPPSAEDAWVLAQVGDGVPLLMPRTTRDPRIRRWLDQYGMRDAVAVPLAGGAGITGVLVVSDRLGDVHTFGHDDAVLLETVANHAGLALRNGELVGQLRHGALHDALTGLPNRVALQRALTAAFEDIGAGRVPGAAVMVLDLDEFKSVNDTLGHQQGDRLLCEVGARLTTAVGAAGTVARLGGDEFAVLVPSTADEDHVLRIGRRMLRALEQPVALDGLEVEVGASVGVALAPLHGPDASALLKRADMAMYDAKASPRRLRVYEPELDTSTPRRLTLVSELRTALQNDEIQVHVQPQARSAGREVVSTEALVRWEHPELGWISPEEFIPVAERSGLIGPLTTRVLDEALKACAGWRSAGHDLGIAVNLSARSLHDADLVEEVARLLRRHDVPPHRLTLEVTESSVMADPARAVTLLHQLRDLGVRLSVDDFGTGYSSLSYLKRLPVQEVKIDRSFVAGLREQGDDVAIVRAIVDLGRHLGLEVVAEGVEDSETWDLLASMGCHLVQGYHLARAMPAGDLLPWLVTRRGAGRPRGGLRAV